MTPARAASTPTSRSERHFALPLPILALLFFFAALLTHFAHDGDVFWHIATGQWILSHGHVPHTDPFSFSRFDAPWIAHEWLAAVAFARVFDVGGWPALLILVAFCAALSYAILLRFLLQRLQPVYAVPLTALAFFLSVHHFLLRPHVLVMPLLVGWVGALVHAADESRPPPWASLGILWIWANLHGSFTFGLLLAGALGAEVVLSAATGPARNRLAGAWLRFLIAGLGVALLTPYGIQGVLFPALLYGHPYLLDMITEWQSPDFHEPQALEFWLLLLVAYALTQGLRLAPLRLLLLLALIHMALHHIRHVALLGLISPLLLAGPLRSQGAAPSSGHQGPGSFNGFCRRFAPRLSPHSAALTSLLLFALIGGAYRANPHPDERLGVFRAIDVARQHGVTGNVLNNPGFGGPLIFRGIRPFIDGRLDLYGEDFLRRYLAAINLQDAGVLAALLDEYRITWTLFDPGRPLVAWLEQSGHWQRLYADRFVVVHVRRGTLPRASPDATRDLRGTPGIGSFQ
ncbi:hypothetical protein [Methylotetracoccus oryzae]|uniref:hypothetical protein n=1 Tax=Methylotetracoccus oryzae TaxID=1919059 RepID=UPI00111A3EB9|nr:hypothetical protein [Methylotetracoccus oryzae]